MIQGREVSPHRSHGGSSHHCVRARSRLELVPWTKARRLFTAPQVKTKEQPDTSALPAIFFVGYAPGQPPEILSSRSGPSSSKPARTLFSRCTTRRTVTPLRDHRGSASSLPMSHRKSVSSPMVRHNGTFKIPPAIQLSRRFQLWSLAADVKLSWFASAHARTRQKILNIAWCIPPAKPKSYSASALPIWPLAELVQPGRVRSLYPRALKIDWHRGTSIFAQQSGKTLTLKRSHLGRTKLGMK